MAICAAWKRLPDQIREAWNTLPRPPTPSDQSIADVTVRLFDRLVSRLIDRTLQPTVTHKKQLIIF